MRVLPGALAEEQDLHVGRVAVARDARRVLVDHLLRSPRRTAAATGRRDPCAAAPVPPRRRGVRLRRGSSSSVVRGRRSPRPARPSGRRPRSPAPVPARRRSGPGRRCATRLRACRSARRRGRRRRPPALRADRAAAACRPATPRLIGRSLIFASALPLSSQISSIDPKLRDRHVVGERLQHPRHADVLAVGREIDRADHRRRIRRASPCPSRRRSARAGRSRAIRAAAPRTASTSGSGTCGGGSCRSPSRA